MVRSLCSLFVLLFSEYEKNVWKQRGFTYIVTYKLQAIHSLHKVDVSVPLLISVHVPQGNTKSLDLGCRLLEVQLYWINLGFLETAHLPPP